MSEHNNEVKIIKVERRTGRDRRTGKLDEKFKQSVDAGFFVDMRKGERRKKPENIVSYN